MLRSDRQLRLSTAGAADYVHDIAYDYYGVRMALCTSSHRISVFSDPEAAAGDEAGGGWVETARMEKAHAGPIWRLSWGHPEHGEPLASCSEDGLVNVWCRGASGAGGGEAAGRVPGWPKRAQLQCDGPVVDARFAPAPLGLKLASCTADGEVKVFECVNSLDLRSWDGDDLEKSAAPAEGPGREPEKSARCLTWPASKQAADAGGAGGPPAGAAAPAHACSAAALDWMPAPLGGGGERGEVLAVGRAGRLCVFEKAGASGWRELASAEAHPVASGGVKDVAWCPNLCRPYEIVATCGAGAALWRIDLARDERAVPGRKEAGGCQLTLLKALARDTDDLCPVWRCSWNLTGTSLALSPEDGEITVWKADASLQWREECEIDLGDTGQ